MDTRMAVNVVYSNARPRMGLNFLDAESKMVVNNFRNA